MRHRWKTIGKVNENTIKVDYKAKKTRIETPSIIYYHDGIYPFQNPRYNKKVKR